MIAGDNAWADNFLFDQLLAEHGFAVLRVDNRGMGRRGRAFEQAAYHDFGPHSWPISSPLSIRCSTSIPQLDTHRMGWWGWSWGGPFTLYALTHSDRFRLGASGAPVTDWQLRLHLHRALPRGSRRTTLGYRNSSSRKAEESARHLILFHGTGDDNVHFANSVQFIQSCSTPESPTTSRYSRARPMQSPETKPASRLFNRILISLRAHP